MKRYLKLLSVLAIGVMVLAACNVFTYSNSDLQGKVITYYATFGSGSPNGYDNTVLTFDSTGKSGTFESQSFTHNFATQSAYTSGKYTDKTWFQNGGAQGTFTYDADTNALSLTATSEYGPKKGAVALNGASLYAAADYSYQDLNTYFANSYGTTVTGASMSMSATISLNADKGYLVYAQGSASNSWVTTMSTSLAATIAGTAYSSAMNNTDTLTISDGTIVEDDLGVFTTTIGSTTTKSTSEYIYNNTILHQFIVGQDDKSDETFSDVWKKDNAVTFQVQQNKGTEINYTGNTPPTAPTVDPTSGTGYTYVDASNNYWIDQNVYTDQYDLTNKDTYIFRTDQADSAARALRAK